MRRNARVAALLVLLASVGCEADPRDASWVLVFEDPSLEMRAVVVEASILEGGCSGVELWSTLLRDDGAMPSMPGVLGPGTYGLAARARDVDCVWYAEGCSPVTLPQPSGTETRVLVRASAVEEPACAGECIAGACPQPDAGPGDAGASDGGGDDAAVPDGGPRDAGVIVDVGPPPDGGCDPAAPPTCTGDVLITCVDRAPVGTMCELGCNGAGDGCRDVLPSNVGASAPLRTGLGDIAVGGGGLPSVWVFDTDDGSIGGYAMPNRSTPRTAIRAAGMGVDAGIRFDVVTPPGGSEVAVFSMNQLQVQMTATLVGVGSRPLVLLVRGTARIAGTVSVGADFLRGEKHPGPGGGAHGGRMRNGAGRGGGARGADPAGGTEDGGGGASFGGRGGAGGAESGAGAAAGARYGNDTLVPLYGGSGGGGGAATGMGGTGGDGAGALQITAGTRINVASSGRIDANGAGGGRGILSMGSGGGGGGGGSGGAVLLEAPDVTLDGRVGANGGAGGRGTVDPTTEGTDGGRGLVDMAPVRGTSSSGAGGGGGDGSDSAGTARAGRAATNSGGGGGGGGRIRVNNTSGGGRAGYASRVLPDASAVFSVGRVPLTP